MLQLERGGMECRGVKEDVLLLTSQARGPVAVCRLWFPSKIKNKQFSFHTIHRRSWIQN